MPMIYTTEKINTQKEKIATLRIQLEDCRPFDKDLIYRISHQIREEVGILEYMESSELRHKCWARCEGMTDLKRITDEIQKIKNETKE